MDSYGKGLPLCQLKYLCLFLTLSQELAVTVRRSPTSLPRKYRGSEQVRFRLQVGSAVRSSGVISGQSVRSITLSQGASINVPSFQSASFAFVPPLALRRSSSFQGHSAASVTSCGSSPLTGPDAKTAARFPRRCARR